MAMAPLSVLISGSGIAGPVCAYWLHRLSSGLIRTTILERNGELRKAGQQIDIRGTGVSVIQRMGVEAEIRSKTTREEGLRIIDGDGKQVAEFPAKTGEFSFVSDIEILRERLVKIFYDKTKDKTKYIFGNHITDLKQDDEKATVLLANGETRDYDLILGADGMWSKTRKLAFPEIKDPLKHLGQYISYFTIPYESEDGIHSQWYNAEGGRSILIRPDNHGCTRAFLSIMSPQLAGYRQLSITDQKAMMREYFLDAGWQAKRIIKGMEKSDDFYMQEIAQVKMPHYSRGRVALLGDAGYCPSPISGMGTTVAIVGAYILAGEIFRAGPDYRKAFQNYEEIMRPYVAKAQNLIPGAPAITCPQTKWGISLLHKFLSFVSWSNLIPLMSKFSGPSGEIKQLPVYEA
ncbi:putative monooxygenase fad-binding protein [Erysiphe necator]|uniref:Putative monooxygenase fad-binding protein n=1 Tax=Uncinula necator TaxID=52586 RepID=A0A0B1P2D3_UNCNE|nr:putative monooxygenase fad-binding protein [Erysiphe necator]